MVKLFFIFWSVIITIALIFTISILISAIFLYFSYCFYSLILSASLPLVLEGLHTISIKLNESKIIKTEAYKTV